MVDTVIILAQFKFEDPIILIINKCKLFLALKTCQDNLNKDTWIWDGVRK